MPARQAIVGLALRDGRTLRHHTLAVRGTAENPMTRAEVDAKGYDLLAPVLGKGARRQVVRYGVESGEAAGCSQIETPC